MTEDWYSWCVNAAKLIPNGHDTGIGVTGFQAASPYIGIEKTRHDLSMMCMRRCITRDAQNGLSPTMQMSKTVHLRTLTAYMIISPVPPPEFS